METMYKPKPDDPRPVLPPSGLSKYNRPAQPPVEEAPDVSGEIKFVQIIRGRPLLNGRVCNTGDVIPVLGLREIPHDQRGIPSLMPPVLNGPIDRDRAVKLIEGRRAVKHRGPAHVVPEPKEPDEDTEDKPVEVTSLNDRLKRAEQATAKPQRGGL